MPELPEVETVRRGLEHVLTDRRIVSATVSSPRTLRRQGFSAEAFSAALTGAHVRAVRRRGKYLWWELSDALLPFLVAHLGMSGQFRTGRLANSPDFGPHERGRFVTDDGAVVCFVDQRTFGWLLADDGIAGTPASIAHIAADPFEEQYDIAAVAARMRSRRTGAKRALLDQTLVSGIGNIYADEALWRARMHHGRATDSLRQSQARALLEAAAAVMIDALAAGGTSFDPLYVDVNGDRGWFGRELQAYGRQGEPCSRCGRPIVREAFMNRSSYRCPRCQRLPVRRR